MQESSTTQDRHCDRICVGLYGTQYHQIGHDLVNHPLARVVATAGIAPEQLPEVIRTDSQVKQHGCLAELLADRRVELVSLCAPRCADHASDAIASFEAGKHVYVEKPAAMTEADLDRVIAAARRYGRQFHEMAGTAFHQPYIAMRRAVESGAIGRVVQVLVQKSYPMHDRRPAEESVDGGLLLQVGVHALRMIEHVAQQEIASIEAIETQAWEGDAVRGELRTACAMQVALVSGAIASAVCNYCNPSGFGRHGNEMLRIFGTHGFVEATDGGRRTRLVTGEHDHGPLVLDAPSVEYHDYYFANLLGQGEMPLTLERELHPLRVLLRARDRRMKGVSR